MGRGAELSSLAKWRWRSKPNCRGLVLSHSYNKCLSTERQIIIRIISTPITICFVCGVGIYYCRGATSRQSSLVTEAANNTFQNLLNQASESIES
jgi:hypothetical protein